MQDRIAPVQAAFDTERARWRGPSANCRLQVCSMNYTATHVAALATNGFFRKCRNGKSGINLSKLNPTPHAIAVYASQQLSPAATQHSLPSGRYSLLGPVFHRLDRTSFAWRTHSMTSSARASSDGGTSRPSALAVLRLMMSSSLVGNSTGKSPGLAPFRIPTT